MIFRMELFEKVDLLKISYWSCWLFEKAEISSSILSPTSTVSSFPVGVVADTAAVVGLRAITEGTSCTGVGTGATVVVPSPERDVAVGTGATPPSPESITAGPVSRGAIPPPADTVKVAGIWVARMGVNLPSVVETAIRIGSVTWLGTGLSSAEEVIADAVLADKVGATNITPVVGLVSGSLEA